MKSETHWAYEAGDRPKRERSQGSSVLRGLNPHSSCGEQAGVRHMSFPLAEYPMVLTNPMEVLLKPAWIEDKE